MASFSARLTILGLLILGIMGTVPNQGFAEEGLTGKQKQEIEKLVHQYILDNPEVIIQTIDRMQAREELAKKERAKQTLAASKDLLLNNPDDPIGGNPEGDVTVVEFFDYRCGYCKRVFPSVMKTIEDDKNVRYVFKEFPILGPESVFASKAALATWRLDKTKYHNFHSAMMTVRGNLTKEMVFKIAAKAGVNVVALAEEMESPEIEKTLRDTYELANSLNITGTPAFVIGNEVIPGAIDLGSLKRLISEARGS